MISEVDHLISSNDDFPTFWQEVVKQKNWSDEALKLLVQIWLVRKTFPS